MSTSRDVTSQCPSYEELAMYAQAGPVSADLDPHIQACPACLGEVRLMHQDAHAVSCLADYLRSPCQSPGATSQAGFDPIPEVDGYVLQGEIARGAQGIVYRAVQEH
ncbi:MAG: hypothetical protein H7210_10535, partial [Pyrinomonadaceae bacterium]|nr:hypothetical protein [Phycisphaerales bacterium]